MNPMYCRQALAFFAKRTQWARQCRHLLACCGPVAASHLNGASPTNWGA